MSNFLMTSPSEGALLNDIMHDVRNSQDLPALIKKRSLYEKGSYVYIVIFKFITIDL